jgi:phospholipid-binding lipoprotein MlaA
MLGSILLALLAGCGTPATPPSGDVDDPNEAQNREMHAFNRAADTVVVRPASQVWGAVVPPPVREGAVNFVRNIDTPGHVVNDLLQGEVDDATHNFFRFAINSTLGVAGLFDPATSMGLEARASDFGQTLYVWGVEEGDYVEMPFYGGRTERHAYGTVVDFVLNPARPLLPVETPSFTSAVVQVVETRYDLGPGIDEILYESADSYALSRSIYLQNRRFFLAEGEATDYFDPYEDLFGE